jgi:UDP-glucose 4-epimerase
MVEQDGDWQNFVQINIAKEIDIDLKSMNIAAVIHCAGLAHRPVEDDETIKLFYEVNREGTRNVVNWCKRIGIPRIVYVSSIAFYDWNNLTSGPLTEDAPLALPTHYARSKYEGEQVVVNSELDWQVVRLATVFGDGDKANFSRLARAQKRRLFIVPGKGSARKSVIPLSVAAELISSLALKDAVVHRIMNIGLPCVPTLGEICNAYHKICGFPAAIHVPIPIITTIAHIGDVGAKVIKKFPFTSQVLQKLTTSTYVSVDRMMESFPEKTFHDFSHYLAQSKDYYSKL